MKYATTYSHSHGSGDFLQGEAFFSDEERESFEVIFMAFNNRQSDSLRSLIEACPIYKHVQIKYLQYPTELVPGAKSTMADHGILHRRQFTGSSFLKYDLAEVPCPLPDRFDFVHPYTSQNTAGVRRQRDIEQDEWAAILDRLEARDTIGIVMDDRVDGPIPESSRLIDMRGTLTLPQAVEVLKRASGYVGIDSCFSLLAGELFGADDLLIRTGNSYIVEHPWVYYAARPVTYLTHKIGAEPYTIREQPGIDPGNVVVELRCNLLVGNRVFGLNERVDISAERADELLALKRAVIVEGY